MHTTTPLTAFVVDDNPAALRMLADDLTAQPEVERVYTFSNYTEATLPLLEVQPDVLFLDVEMPGRSGLEFLDSIRSRLTFSFRVVFYTAFSHYMLDAIRQSAYDFLLKPYKLSELREVIKRLTDASHSMPQKPLLTDNVLSRKIAMQTVSELLLVRGEEILMLNYESKSRSWRLILTDRTTHCLKKGMKADELLALHAGLARINNTCILNLAYLAAVENNTQRCRLSPPFDDYEVIVSRRYFARLKERLELL